MNGNPSENLVVSLEAQQGWRNKGLPATFLLCAVKKSCYTFAPRQLASLPLGTLPIHSGCAAAVSPAPKGGNSSTLYQVGGFATNLIQRKIVFSSSFRSGDEGDRPLRKGG